VPSRFNRSLHTKVAVGQQCLPVVLVKARTHQFAFECLARQAPPRRLRYATLDANTRKPSHHNTTEKFVVAILLQKLQFVLKIQYISVVISRHGTVVNTVYWHHQYWAYRIGK
jgi:hypothetical protein